MNFGHVFEERFLRRFSKLFSRSPGRYRKVSEELPEAILFKNASRGYPGSNRKVCGRVPEANLCDMYFLIVTRKQPEAVRKGIRKEKT